MVIWGGHNSPLVTRATHQGRYLPGGPCSEGRGLRSTEVPSQDSLTVRAGEWPLAYLCPQSCPATQECLCGP